jgi:SAM-dependent methyltransferase
MKQPITHSRLLRAGFSLVGETYIKESIKISLYEDEDRVDTYTLNGTKVTNMDQINQNGIFTPEQAKSEHKTSFKLARKLTKVLPANKMVIDFGCGTGEYIKRLANVRFKVKGYEGQPLPDAPNFIKKQDITKPIKNLPKGSVLCLEVMEHIPAKLESAVLKNIDRACTGRLVLSWGVVGQGGCGHVNEQNSNYVIPTIEALGFELNRALSEELRAVAGVELSWFGNSIYVFDRKGGK